MFSKLQTNAARCGAPRQGGRTAHHAMCAALLRRNLRMVGEASRISGVRPFHVNVDSFEVTSAGRQRAVKSR
jgi:hypothetical protein